MRDMTWAARAATLLCGALLAACAWLPWYATTTAMTIPSRGLWDPSAVAGAPGSSLATLAFLLWVAGALVVLGALLGARAIAVVGALAGTASAVVWVLSNAVSVSAGAVSVAHVRYGAYLALGSGVAALLIAALSRDTASPTLR